MLQASHCTADAFGAPEVVTTGSDSRSTRFCWKLQLDVEGLLSVLVIKNVQNP